MNGVGASLSDFMAPKSNAGDSDVGHGSVCSHPSQGSGKAEDNAADETTVPTSSALCQMPLVPTDFSTSCGGASEAEGNCSEC